MTEGTFSTMGSSGHPLVTFMASSPPMTEGTFFDCMGVFRAPLGDHCGSCPPPTTEGTFSNCTGVPLSDLHSSHPPMTEGPFSNCTEVFMPLAKPRTVLVLADLGPYLAYILPSTKKSLSPLSAISPPHLHHQLLSIKQATLCIAAQTASCAITTRDPLTCIC